MSVASSRSNSFASIEESRKNNNNNDKNNNNDTYNALFLTTSITDTDTVSANTSQSYQKKEQWEAQNMGVLEATILSVYDLPMSTTEPPCVQLNTCGIIVESGPPVSRHKQKQNSFRFKAHHNNNNNNNNESNDNNQSNVLHIAAPLPELYASKLRIEILQPQQQTTTNNTQLYATYELNQLNIHQSTWLILTLKQDQKHNEQIINGSMAIADSKNTTTTNNNNNTTLSTTATPQLPPSPTIRLKLQLQGCYRPEIAFLIQSLQSWFAIVDKMQQIIVGNNYHTIPNNTFKTMSASFQNNKSIWVAIALPILTTVVVSSPIIFGILLIGFPFFIPLMVLCFIVGLSFLWFFMLLYASTKHGRDTIVGTTFPFLDAWLSTTFVQAMLYNIGPRPTPVSILRDTVIPTNNNALARLVLSLWIDLMGSASYFIPLIGELGDIFWAPIQTTLIMAMYNDSNPNLKYLSFAEEALPFTDIVPSATIGWAYEYFFSSHNDKQE